MGNDVGNIIKKLRTEKGMTLEELGNKVGVGKSTVRKWENGMITNMRRDKIEKLADALDVSPLKILGRPDVLPKNISVPAARAIPILGTICAGNGIITQQDFQGFFFVDNSIKADYTLYIHGDSMIGAGIYDGDIAFLIKDFNFLDGKIYGVIYGAENECVLKKVYRQNGSVILQPCNDAYSPIILRPDDVWIVGMLIGTYHNAN